MGLPLGLSSAGPVALLAIGLGVMSPAAQAGWSVSGDVEHFKWRESTTPAVTETGPIFGLGVHWTQDRPAGWGFAYHGRLYFGSVDYDGSLLFTGEPVTGTTEYSGLRNEAQNKASNMALLGDIGSATGSIIGGVLTKGA